MSIKANTVNYHQQSKVLEIGFDNGETCKLRAEYLRVYSPSAEVKGHGPGQEVLQFGKLEVAINTIKVVGNYAIQPTFSDGHDTGIYSWQYLYALAQEETDNWQDYLRRLAEAGQSRDPQAQVLKL